MFFTSSALISFSFSEAILSSSYMLTGSCNDLPDSVIVIALLFPLRRATQQVSDTKTDTIQWLPLLSLLWHSTTTLSLQSLWQLILQSKQKYTTITGASTGYPMYEVFCSSKNRRTLVLKWTRHLSDIKPTKLKHTKLVL